MVIKATWQEGFLSIATDRSIGAECYRVLFAILGSLTDESFAPMTPTLLAQVLHMHESSVKRAVRVLVAKGVLRKRLTQAGKLIGYEVVEFFGAESHERS